MSREIKFRIWDKKSKKMRNVESIGFGMIGISTKGYPVVNALGRNCIENEDILIHRENGEYELMRYTGLKDKNSVDIYEGDIIKYGKNIFLIVYSENIASFTVDFKRTDKKVNCYPNVNKGTMLNAEVIGNIYTNKELLEVFND